ncbi:MAG: helix-hairpin-helix domain-containing protein [Pirellulales bacterium]|nr:helix-hairpin-helix domain-containing protein [Pirellulales bacterium]
MAPRQKPPPNPPHTRVLLRRADQAVVASLLLVGLVALAVYYVGHYTLGDGLIEIDRASRRDVKFLVDINAADWPELAQLPGIGETLARRIVESRQALGPYRDHRDLERVPGIGPLTLERIGPHLLPLAESSSVAGS